jgi:hypothetical protein
LLRLILKTLIVHDCSRQYQRQEDYPNNIPAKPMKTLIVLTLSILLLACATANSADAAPKPKKKLLKGSWDVTDIRFVGDKGLYKATLFELADSPCFKGSAWVFIPNNGSGKFSISSTASQCQPSSNRIHWSFYESADGVYQFQFKYVDEKGKPLDAGNRGYRATIDDLNESVMVLRVATTYQGNPFDVVMTFTKTSDDITL